jgi:antirestriction protein ArdC
MDATKPKIDVFEIVTNQIIQLLESGKIPWQIPWAEAGLPANLISKRAYRGLNVWLLCSLNYEQNFFLTWDQLKAIGGSVKQGEKGHVVVFWKTVPKTDTHEQQTGEQEKAKVILRYYKVFNISQCKDIPEALMPVKMERHNDPIIECDSIIHGMPGCPVIQHKEQRAYYHIGEDYINMPKKKSFKSCESYYLTLFHELIHSTGHEKRLNRKSVNEMAEFADNMYSMEELIAELGACYLASYAGTLHGEITNSAAYIQGWLKKFKDDKKFLVFAASYAQKAVDFILNQPKPESESKETEPTELLVEG